MDFNPISFLRRAEDFYSGIDAYGLPSSKMKMYFEVSEQALKAIFFHYGVASHSGSHQLTRTARENQVLLAPIWTQLEPLLQDYPTLYSWRNEAGYRHNDAPPVSDPPILESDLEMGKKVAGGILAIARNLIV